MSAAGSSEPWVGQAASAPVRRVASIVLEGSIGTVIEWYDVRIYGIAALVFNGLFYPKLAPATGIIAALGTMAVMALSLFGIGLLRV